MLLKIKDKTKPKLAKKTDILTLEKGHNQILANTGAKLVRETLPDKLEMNSTYHYWSKGGFSMYHVLGYILEKTGPAHCVFTTWAISEQSVRNMHAWKKNGTILSLKALVDERALSQHAAALFQLKGFIDKLKLSKCHAKVLICQNDDWNIIVSGSANFTENPRYETGFLSTDNSLVEFHVQWIKKEIENGVE